MTDDLCVTYEQERQLLAYLQALHPAPWACSCCREQITPNTGWKPMIAFVSGGKGVVQVVVEITCGLCLPASPPNPED
jgi:hypothetical protein